MLKYGDPGYMEEDKGPMLYSITFSFLAVAIIMVILRLFCRWFLFRSRNTILPENLIIASILVDIASCVLIHYQIKTGMGKHIEYSRARPKMLQKSMIVGLAQNSCYQALIGLVKMSILAQFHRIASTPMQRRVVVWIGAFVLVFTLFTVFAAIFQCIPMQAAWDLENFPKGCWNMMGVNFFTSSVNTILDFIIFALPIHTLFHLQMVWKKKITLACSYGVGVLVIACSIIRLRNIVHFNGEGDFTYVASMVPVWGAIECNAGIICASLPFIVPLIKKMSGSAIDSMTGTRLHLKSQNDRDVQLSDIKRGQVDSRHQSETQLVPAKPEEHIRVDYEFGFGVSDARESSDKQ